VRFRSDECSISSILHEPSGVTIISLSNNYLFNMFKRLTNHMHLRQKCTHPYALRSFHRIHDRLKGWDFLYVHPNNENMYDRLM
jgi:hypothetical protein